MIKAIFFDFDGVLTTDSNGSGTVCRNLQKSAPNLSFDDLYRCYRAHHSLLLLGKAKHADIWDAFCACLGKEIDITLLQDAFLQTPKNEPMFRLNQVLRKKYKTGIITDNTKERFQVLRKGMRLDEYFDAIVLSADVGTRKNEPLVFEAALRLLHCNANECIFIDNQQRNLEIPATMGFKTFWHNDEKNDLSPLLEQLQEWGLDVILRP